jgi:hypothetical protein
MTKVSVFSMRRFQCSGFSVQVGILRFGFLPLCFFLLTPDTRHPEIWCLKFDILQRSAAPVLQEKASALWTCLPISAS